MSQTQQLKKRKNVKKQNSKLNWTNKRVKDTEGFNMETH